MKKIIVARKKVHKEEPHNLYYKYYYGNQNKDGEMDRIYTTQSRQIFCKNLKERDHLEDLHIDKKLVLK